MALSYPLGTTPCVRKTNFLFGKDVGLDTGLVLDSITHKKTWPISSHLDLTFTLLTDDAAG